jgi:hypothetical protein
MADSKITGLTQDTAPSLTDLIVTVKDPGGTPLSRKVTLGDAFKLLQGNVIYLTNNDGVAHYAGTVVIFDTSIDNGCKKTTLAGDPKICGVAAETVAAGATGKYYQVGQATVLVQGNVSRGMWVTASATSGRAQASTYTKPSSGGIGIALTSYAGGGAGSVTVMIQIQLTSTAPLQQLATATSYTATGTAVSATHITDAGTDLLVVRVGCYANSDPSSVTFNGVGLTKHVSINNASNTDASIWYLKSPPIGSYTLTVNHGSSNVIRWYATNYAGSQATPLRTGSGAQGSSTTASVTPTSAVGDIVIDCLKLQWATAGWTPTASQTAEVADVADATGRSSDSYKAGAAGTTTMSYGGGASQYSFVSAAIAGS